MSRTSVRWASAFLAWSILFNISAIPTTAAPSRLQSSPQASVPSVLKPGVPVERGLKGGETHAFQIPLKAGQFCSVVVEQKGIDVVVAVFNPKQEKSVEVDSPNGIEGSEPVLLIVEATGTYRVEVRSLEKTAPSGMYEIQVLELRAAVAEDHKRIEASKAFAEAEVLLRVNPTEESITRSIQKYEDAAAFGRATKDATRESQALYGLGVAYLNLGNPRKSLEIQQTALAVTRTLGNPRREALILNDIGFAFEALGDRRKALEHYQEALTIRERLGDLDGQARTLSNIGSAFNYLGEKLKAREAFFRALETARTVKNPETQAFCLAGLGLISQADGDARTALEYHMQALNIHQTIGNRRGEGQVLNNIGFAHAALGEPSKALEFYARAVTVGRRQGDLERQAVGLTNQGNVYAEIGEYQKALDVLREALELKRTIGNPAGIAATLVNIGRVYRDLGDSETGLKCYREALPLLETAGNRSGAGNTLLNIGSVYFDRKEYEQAADCFQRALALFQAAGDRAGEGTAFGNIGTLNRFLNHNQKAVEYWQQALTIHTQVGNRRSETTTLNNLGHLYGELKDTQKAFECFTRSRDVARSIGFRKQEHLSLFNMAYLKRDLGILSEARADIEKALEIVESLRAGVLLKDLRSSFVSSVRKYYELHADVLMQLHKQDPKAGHDLEALQVSERARARSMLELLTEARFDIRRGVDPELLERERSLRQLLNAKEDRRLRIFAGKSTPGQKREIENEVETITNELNDIETKIRAASPKYAALTQPAPLSAKGVQEQILDADTVLFEYFLGEKRSWLWVVTPTSVTTHELPPQAEIEEAAEDFRDALIAERSGKRNITSLPKSADETEDTLPDYKTAADRLSRMILGPAAAHLNAKRIVVVPDGALHYVPFAALPVPRKERGQTASFSALLIERSEIVVLPSASTLAVLRRETAGRKPAEKTLAVFADPVFTERDDRVAEARSRSMKSPASPEPPPAVSRGVVLNVPGNPLKNVARDELQIERSLKLLAEKLPDSDELRIPRLPFTRVEAERITALAPAGETWTALDFRAGRDQVLDPELGRYRIVHFATHGYVDAERPELSALLLSMFDEQGNPRDGFLRTHEIYNLNLPADLVVLSACKTGLGKNVKGEGLVGMTRGFMYAGAKRVVVSLWAVNDKATAELMTEFYDGMLRRNLRPAAALRAAQIKLLKRKPWSAPFFWAGFQIQGEWW